MYKVKKCGDIILMIDFAGSLLSKVIDKSFLCINMV